MKMIYGDLIEAFQCGDIDVMIHGCNCFHTMGSGIADIISNIWPEVLDADKRYSKYGDRSKLGSYTFAEVERRCGRAGFVLNAYSQYRYGYDGPHVDYDAIGDAFLKVKNSKFGKSVIGIPMIGTGLAGGNWDKVSNIIDKVEIPDITTYFIGR